MSTMIPVPTIAFAMPPPSSPTGVGRWKKKAGVSPGNPCLTTCHRMSASGEITISAATWHAMVAPRSAKRRAIEGPRATRRESLGGAGDVTSSSGAPDHQDARAGVHEHRHHEQHERELDQGRQMERTGRLAELVGD